MYWSETRWSIIHVTWDLSATRPGIRSFFSSSQSQTSDVVLSIQNTDSRDSTLNGLQTFHGLLTDKTDNGMFCTLCQKHNKMTEESCCATWVDITCITFTRQSLTNHEAAKSHKETARLEVQLSSPGIVQVLSNVESTGRKAITQDYPKGCHYPWFRCKWEDIWAVEGFSYFALMVDETTDIAVAKEVIIYAR